MEAFDTICVSVDSVAKTPMDLSLEDLTDAGREASLRADAEGSGRRRRCRWEDPGPLSQRHRPNGASSTPIQAQTGRLAPSVDPRPFVLMIAGPNGRQRLP